MKNIIITAGGTSEEIDNVRKITNSSTGKLGMIIADEILNTHGNDIDNIYYICSKNSLRPIHKKIKIIEISNTFDLKEEVEKLLKKKNIDCFIHSMAVSDYTLDYVTNIELLSQEINEHINENIESVIKNNKRIIKDKKISSYSDNLIIVLKPTPKIIKLIKELSPNTFLVGFKLLDDVSEEELIKVSIALRDKNKCDIVVANDLENIRNGIHKAFIIDTDNNIIIANGKDDIAKKLVGKIYN